MYVTEVKMPKLGPPPPRNAQKRSGLVKRLAITRFPFGRTTLAWTILSTPSSIPVNFGLQKSTMNGPA